MAVLPAPPRRAFAVYDEHGVPHSEYKRICLRCGRPMLGYSYRTFYGVLIIGGTRVQVGGEPLHDICPGPDATPRVPWHDANEFWGQDKKPKPQRRYVRRTETRVEPNIRIQSNGRYSVRVKKHRFGTYETIEQARAARDQFIKQRGRNNGKRQERK